MAQTTAAVSTQGVAVLGGFLQEDLDLSNADIGALAGVLNVAPILGLLLVGEWLDRAGERLVIGAGALIMGVAMAFASLISDFPGLLVCLLFVGVGYSTAQPGGSKAVFHWFSIRERGRAMGVRQAGLPLGSVTAAAIFPGVASSVGWQAAFLVGAVVVVAGGGLFCLIYRRPPDATSPKAARAEPRQRPMAHARALLSVSAFRLAALGGVVLITVQTIALMFLALYFRDHFHMPLVIGATHLLVMQLAGAAGRILLAAWSDHPGQNRATIVVLTAIGALLGLAAVGVFPTDWNRGLLFLGSAWLGFFGFGWYGPWVTWISELSPRDRLGATLGIAMAINQVAIVATPLLFGALVDATAGFAIPGIALMGALATYIVYVGARSFGSVKPQRHGDLSG